MFQSRNGPVKRSQQCGLASLKRKGAGGGPEAVLRGGLSGVLLIALEEGYGKPEAGMEYETGGTLSEVLVGLELLTVLAEGA
jgi:hypothetical protein